MSDYVGPPQPNKSWAVFHVGASHVCAGALRACLAPGARRVGSDVRAVGGNCDISARETEVRVL